VNVDYNLYKRYKKDENNKNLFPERYLRAGFPKSCFLARLFPKKLL